MPESAHKYFGYLIAFGLPGFLLVWGGSLSSPQLASWLVQSSTPNSPSIGGFLYSTVASFACGLFLSAVRQTIVDRILYSWRNDLKKPTVEQTAALIGPFQAVIENNYRYFQCYTHSALAILFASVLYLFHDTQSWPATILVWPYAKWMLLAVAIYILFDSGIDELKAFNRRTDTFARLASANSRET
jgi:hypothetical protein